jgi:hypothetical protein
VHRFFTQPHAFASTLVHIMLIVHACPGRRGVAFALATQRVA